MVRLVCKQKAFPGWVWQHTFCSYFCLLHGYETFLSCNYSYPGHCLFLFYAQGSAFTIWGCNLIDSSLYIRLSLKLCFLFGYVSPYYGVRSLPRAAFRTLTYVFDGSSERWDITGFLFERVDFLPGLFLCICASTVAKTDESSAYFECDDDPFSFFLFAEVCDLAITAFLFLLCFFFF